MTESRINAFRSAVVARVAAILPAAAVEKQFGRFNLDELAQTSIRCPAVRIAVLSGKLSTMASGQSEATPLQCAAFVITDGKARDESAWAMAEALGVNLHVGQMWGLTKIGGPSGVTITPAVTAEVKNRGVAIIAVEWRQELRQLGEGIFDASGRLFEGLYINDEEIEIPEQEGGNEQP